MSVTIRVHPSEEKDKYKNYLEDPIICIENKDPLILQILQHDYVFGCNTMALAIGVLAKKKVISCIPPYVGQENVFYLSPK